MSFLGGPTLKKIFSFFSFDVKKLACLGLESGCYYFFLNVVWSLDVIQVEIDHIRCRYVRIDDLEKL